MSLIRMIRSRRNCLSSLTILGCASLLPSLVSAQDFDLSRYRGSVVYLDFWASWCGPCLQSFPWLAQMHEKYADQGLRIVAVNLDKQRPAADRFLRRVPAPFELVFDPKGTLAERFEVSGMPHSFMFDRNGKPL